jgi:glutamate dehydrogenase (NAD(P)+)
VAIPAAQDLIADGAKVVAVSDVTGGIYNEHGLDIEDVIKYVKQNKFLKGYPKAEAISNNELFALNVDILIPAAIDSVITKDNAHTVKAKVIAEGANGPLTTEAIDIVSRNGSIIIPDILCNAGGVIVSYFEWVQGIAQFFWGLDEINKRLHDILKQSFDRVYENHKRFNVGMKQAALITSLERLQGAMRLRGMWPG